jgi:hypothetical protein
MTETLIWFYSFNKVSFESISLLGDIRKLAAKKIMS